MAQEKVPKLRCSVIFSNHRIRKFVTREPGGTEFGERCRKLFLAEKLDGLTEACLAFASRNEHILKN